jgi:hypothetical protein
MKLLKKKRLQIDFSFDLFPVAVSFLHLTRNIEIVWLQHGTDMSLLSILM